MNDYELQESEGSKLGAYYMSPAGQPILNESERTIAMLTKDKQLRKMTFQVAKTTEALASVSKIVGDGNAVVFDSEGSYIMNKLSGEITWLREGERRVLVGRAGGPGELDTGAGHTRERDWCLDRSKSGSCK